jgi:tight adherence protein B
MEQSLLFTFLILVFGTIFILSQLILLPTFGTRSHESKLMRKRLKEVNELQGFEELSLVRQKYLRELSPFEQWIESLPGINAAEDLIEQCGKEFPAYQLYLGMAFLALFFSLLAWFLTHNYLATGLSFLIGFYFPIIKLKSMRNKRLEMFEEQLPDALDMMSRALRAGYPFNDAMHYIATEMPDPMAHEFKIVFDEINYGRDLKHAFHYLIYRIPSTNLLTLTTAILIQHESGGNLAELLDNVSSVLRSRIKFHRKIRTMTAEGRVSAWVLSMLPFAVFVAIFISNPNFLDPLLEEDLGHNLLAIGIALQIIGAFWVSRLIDIDV